MDDTNQKNMISKTTYFARGKISQVLSVEQNRIVNLAMSMVKENEDPEAQAQYVLPIAALARQWGVGERTLARNLDKAAKDLDDSMPHLHYDEIVNGELQHVHVPIFQDVRVGTAPKRLIVRFAYEIRKALINMRREYDIIYPVQTPNSFERKYTPILHDYLLAKMREQVDGGHAGNRFVVAADIDDLQETIPYNWEQASAVSKFTHYVIKDGCKDLNAHSEIYVENDMPELIKECRRTVGYEFHIVLRSNLVTPIFPIHTGALKSLPESKENHHKGIPNFDYIIDQLHLEQVNESYIKKVEYQHDTVRAWTALLYARIHGSNTARYFNTAYEGKNFVIEDDPKDLLRGFISMHPECEDRIITEILDYYDEEDKKIHEQVVGSLTLPQKNGLL